MESFFPGVFAQTNTNSNNNIQSGNGDQTQADHLILLSGPPSSGKSSLLFQFAFNSAMEATNRDVIFICNRRKLESNPPCLAQALGTSPYHTTPHFFKSSFSFLFYFPVNIFFLLSFTSSITILSQGIHPSSQVFTRIHMKYLDDDEGIKNYFAAFHLLDTLPVSVIIDDFGDFFDEKNCQERYSSSRGKDLAMVRVLALCQNAIAHANEAGPCRLLLSDTHHGDSPRLLYIYKTWISSIYTIKGNGFGSFFLRNSNHSRSDKSQNNRIAKYSIALQYLVLEAITKDEEK